MTSCTIATDHRVARPLAGYPARRRDAGPRLDSVPDTGRATTSDALWMGMPVAMPMGGTFPARV